MVQLQRAAARLMVETQRYRRLAERSRSGGDRNGARALRQYRRVDAAEREVEALAAIIEARLNAHKAEPKR